MQARPHHHSETPLETDLMTFPDALKLYAIAVPTFFVVDMLWLGVVARGFYRNALGPLMKTDVNWPAALAFYLLFIAGMLVFVVVPALERASLARAVWMGGFFGLVTYATYDLTNLATLEGFPARMVPVDLVWGAVLCAVVCTVTFLVGQRIT